MGIIGRLLHDEWIAIPCKWPYPPGYATYNPHTKTVLDTGLTKAEAEAICKGLNQKGGSK